LIVGSFRPEGILEKWLAAKKLEWTNWGLNKERFNLDYIKAQMKKGDLFQALSKTYLYVVKPEFEGDLNFAPGYVWKNKKNFAHLLYPDAA